MKAPWIKPIIAGLVLLLAIASIHYLAKRLPPSKVNLVFKGWKKVGTNTYADFDLTNEGPRSIYWSLDGAIIAEMESGWMTNRFKHFTYEPVGTPPASNELVFTEIPRAAKRWMVRVDYSSYERHQLRFETAQKFAASGVVKRHPQFFNSTVWFWNLLTWGANFSPEPKAEYHQIVSEIFTNQLPNELVDLVKSR